MDYTYQNIINQQVIPQTLQQVRQIKEEIHSEVRPWMEKKRVLVGNVQVVKRTCDLLRLHVAHHGCCLQ